MACDWVKVRAPGSVMLFGEHAVLAGEAAMAAAIAQYLTVTLEKRSDDLLEIASNIFPPYTSTLKELKIAQPYTFVLACLMQQKQNIPCGLRMHIHSEIDPTLGLGSSAAVTVAILTALKQMFNLQDDIFSSACNVIRTLQGQGSGMDALASLHGGALYYLPQTQQHIILTPRSDLHLLYCGYKTATDIVLQQVRNTFRSAENELTALYRAIGQTVQLAYTAWQKEDRGLLAQCMQTHQGLQKALEVSDPHCEHLMQWLKTRVAVEAVKISGSGLGDCLLALGGNWQDLRQEEITALHPKARHIPLSISNTGVSLVL